MNQQKREVDIIIKNGVILTINNKDEIIKNGIIVIDDGCILDLGKYSDLEDKYKAKKEINAKGKVIMPGLINTHTHLAMSIFRGLADDLPLEKWLNEYIFPAEDKFINENSCYWGAKLSLAEMILSGTTTFCDMYFLEKEVGRAMKEVGMRGIIGEGVVTLFGNENEILKNKIELTENLLEEFKNNTLISIAIEPHSCYTCSEKILRELKKYARENHLLYITHLAETKKEICDLKNKFEMSPVRYLDKIGVLDEMTLVAHCIWIDNLDLEILKKRGVKVSHCPESNMKLASGIAPVQKFLENNILVSLGTDGSASNNDLDMFSEMDSAAKLAKVSLLDSTVVRARDVVRMATINGAKALNLDDKIGSLEVGKNADLIILDFNKPHLTPVYDYYSHLVYAVSGGDVESSIINGIVVMENRELLTFNVEETMKEVKKIASKILNYNN